MTDTPAAAALAEARAATLALVAPLTDEQIETQFTPLMSPLVWDLAHIAAYEDLWIGRRHGGRPLLRPELAALYDAFETPRPARGSLPLLDTAGAREYLDAVRDRTLAVLADAGPEDGTLLELVVRHELQHSETMLQALELARVEGYVPVERAALPAAPDGAADPLDLVEVPGGRCAIGARATGFAYDNERPRHALDVAPFRIARRPVTNATWMHFVEGGGYERREWWSDEGWAWKEEYDISRPGGWSGDGREWRITGFEPLAPSAPVSHVSWFEADAFARSLGARLPTEVEWEKAATWDQETRRTAGPPASEEHATLGGRAFAPAPAGSRPAGAAPSGCEQMIGDVWEWTSSAFGGYAGFVAHPYREYSEIFFGTGHRVLRGGSWATAPRVAMPTFRNWDLPQRRQIFAGVRLAADA
jgi:iron(II)-dependent oxidoreductase